MKSIVTTALILSAGLVANTASAADPHLDELAFTLKQQAALACREVRYGFRRTPAFPHLYKDFYELYTLADHVHDVAHHGGDLCHLKDDVNQMDQLFHHTEELVAPFTQPQPIGRGCRPPACGEVSSYHLRRLQRIMVDMEETLHHLQDDLEAELAPGGALPPLPPGQLGPGGPQLSPGNSGFAPPSRPLPSPGPGIGFRGRNGQVAFTIRLGG